MTDQVPNIDPETGEVLGQIEVVNQFQPEVPMPKPAPETPQADRPDILNETDLTDSEMPRKQERTALALKASDPRSDEKVMALSEEIIRVCRYAETFQVTDIRSAKTATNDLTCIANLKKALEAKRKEYKAPVLDHAKRIDEVFNLLVTPLLQADKSLREKVVGYNNKIEAERKAIIEANRLREELARKEAEIAGKPPDQAVVPVAPVPDQRTKVSSDIGTVSFVYQPNKDRIEQAIRSGVKDIKGIAIWFEPKWKVLNIKDVPDEYRIKTTRVVGK